MARGSNEPINEQDTRSAPKPQRVPDNRKSGAKSQRSDPNPLVAGSRTRNSLASQNQKRTTRNASPAKPPRKAHAPKRAARKSKAR